MFTDLKVAFKNGIDSGHQGDHDHAFQNGNDYDNGSDVDPVPPV